jgi:hypothetical protein
MVLYRRQGKKQGRPDQFDIVLFTFTTVFEPDAPGNVKVLGHADA